MAVFKFENVPWKKIHIQQKLEKTLLGRHQNRHRNGLPHVKKKKNIYSFLFQNVTRFFLQGNTSKKFFYVLLWGTKFTPLGHYNPNPSSLMQSRVPTLCHEFWRRRCCRCGGSNLNINILSRLGLIFSLAHSLRNMFINNLNLLAVSICDVSIRDRD